jgi:hypothetical protein
MSTLMRESRYSQIRWIVSLNILQRQRRQRNTEISEGDTGVVWYIIPVERLEKKFRSGWHR